MDFLNKLGKKASEAYHATKEKASDISEEIKLKSKGRSGGHNGLKDIENHLKTTEYKRLKLGISNNKSIDTKDYVLGKFNKMDKENANPDRIMTEMAELNITPEAWGGNVPFINISAKTGMGIDKLLETILAISEIAELKANPSRYAVGSVIESRQDKNIGGVASILITNGTLRLGDPIVVGTTFGKVRTMKNDLGESITTAAPGTPVEITGLNENPSAGDKFMAFETEHEAKDIATKSATSAKESKYKKDIISLDDLFNKINEGQKEINVVLKADVRGSEEAVKNSLLKIDVEGVKINVIRSGIGTITESDVVLANASNAIIIGFNVSPTNTTKEIAKVKI